MDSEKLNPDSLLRSIHVESDGEAGTQGGGQMRADRFLANAWPDLSRSRLQQLIKDGSITLNGQPMRASERIQAGDELVARIPPPVPLQELLPCAMQLDILWEDSFLLVINKPPGLVVHPGAGTGEDTLVHGLMHYCKDLSGIGGIERPGIVHRLDKETSGCLVVAKNDTAHQSLAAQFAGREVDKIYLAAVKGHPRRPFGTINAAIGRHPVQRQKMAIVDEERGRAAVTDWRCLATGDGMSLVQCHPRTGRTHQIRVHMKHLGHPILGDPVYGIRGSWPRHLLHAWKLSFQHPSTGKTISCEAPVPGDFPLLPPQGG